MVRGSNRQRLFLSHLNFRHMFSATSLSFFFQLVPCNPKLKWLGATASQSQAAFPKFQPNGAIFCHLWSGDILFDNFFGLTWRPMKIQTWNQIHKTTNVPNYHRKKKLTFFQLNRFKSRRTSKFWWKWRSNKNSIS